MRVKPFAEFELLADELTDFKCTIFFTHEFIESFKRDITALVHEVIFFKLEFFWKVKIISRKVSK